MLIDWQKILDDMGKIDFNSADDSVSWKFVDFNSADDLVSWKFGPLGRFSVKSVYNVLTISDSGPYHKKNLERQSSSKNQNISLVINEQCYSN